ncbi:MAG: hypothetical protein LBK12_04830 [Odoribacteraceae bacterium]|jgi:hypothetical protein|nr:hypothetical protein [Odoribacteraceae bacterium]
MKKNIFSFMSAAVLLLAVGLAGCSREDANEEEMRTILLRVKLAETRANADEVTAGTTVAFKAPGKIFFVTTSGTIMKVMTLGATAYDAGTNANGVNLGDITAGTVVAIQNVPASSSQVYVVGTLTGTGLLSAAEVGDKISDVLSEAVLTATAVYKDDGTVDNVPVLGFGTIVYASASNNYTAAVEVAPVVGRVELEKISANKAEITSFTVDAIYVNMYYSQLGLNGTILGDGTENPFPNYLVDNEDIPDNYAQENAGRYFGKPEVFDVFTGSDGESDASDVVTFAPKDVMAYNLLAPVKTGYFPHLVIRIKNVDPVDDALDNGYGGANVWYLTVTNVVTAGQAPVATNFLNFAPGEVYHINDLYFGLGDLSPVPEPSDKLVNVTVTVKSWKVIGADPVLGN